MLDRWISGAGAVTDGADRSVRLLVGGWRGGFAMTRPGSVIVAVLLLVLAAILVAAGLEVTDPATPVALDPAQVSTARDLGDRTYSTMTGSLSTAWIETYLDGNGNGIEDADETSVAWYYWLVDPIRRRGVTVRSTRPPAEVYTFRGSGILTKDPKYRAEDDSSLDDEVARIGISVEPAAVVDTTDAIGATVALDPAGPMPSAGTAVEVTGARTGAYRIVCSSDSNRDGRCGEDEPHQYEIVVFDRSTKHGIRVLVRRPPEFSDATVIGLLRREERAIDDAKVSQGFEFGDLDLRVSDRYLLDEAVPPGSGPLAYLLALGCVTAAGTILVGLAGGYLIYRRSETSLPVAATTLAARERLPLRITGIIRTPTGREHVREAPGELVRFVMGREVPVSAPAPASEPSAEPGSPAGGGPEGPALDDEAEAARSESAAEPSPPTVDEPVTSTLLVERVGFPHGVAVGLGELGRLSAGRVMAFRGPRPAIRVVAGTGPLFLSFDTEADRDRAAAELLDESGLGPDGKPIQTP
jgi:hypothetical protein